MIHKVSIQNFKSLKDVNIELERFTVFVGANGSGKTSVLEAIRAMARAVSGDPAKVFRQETHCDWLYTRGGVGDLAIGCVTEAGEFSVTAIPPEGFLRAPGFLGHGHWRFEVSAGPDTPPDEAINSAAPLAFLRLNAAQLAKPSYGGREFPRIRHDGKGLASALADMALRDPDAFAELLGFMRELIPQMQRIRFRRLVIRRREIELIRFDGETVERATKRPYRAEAILFDFKNATSLAAQTVSEGTLFLTGLLTVLLGPNRPRILLLDDLEHSLHPLAQKQLVEVIGKILSKYPDLQILATAHSPYLLNYLTPEQVRIMATGSDGYAHCGRLTDHPKFATWKEEMAPGEMWSLFGEKWIADKETAS